MFGWSSPSGSAAASADVPDGPLDALARWSREQPERPVYTFVGDKGEQVAQLTYAQLESASDNVARHLRLVVKMEVGARALLVYPPGLDFIVAYLGCLRAGVIAVPAFPPEPNRLSKDLVHFASTQASCGAKVALTNTLYSHAKKLAGLAQLLKRDGGKWPELTWVVTDAIGKAPLADLERPPPSAVAFLQYTSGSTAEPKGVRITHVNLAHNIRWIIAALQVDRSTVEVSWLPQYHDMGLIGAYLGLLVCGGEGTYTSPFSFVRDATLWPRLLSEKRATHTQAPSFAFALAARKWAALDAKARPSLRLSSLRHAINGAEPIDPEAITAFVRAFSPYGLRRDAIVPTYGLAEHTVFVCTGGKQLFTISRAALEKDRLAVPASSPSSPDAMVAVGCGAPPSGSDIVIKIVDPERGVCLFPTARGGGHGAASGWGGHSHSSEHAAVGEIWLSSPSVADGYWTGDGRSTNAQLAQLSAETFGAVIAGEDGGRTYLRTGDLGFVHGGELFVCGRQKDLLIVRGRNHYPQDLERAAEKAAPELRPGCCTVFAVPAAEAAAAPAAEARAAAQRALGAEASAQELVVLVAEVRNEAAGKAEEVASRVASAVTSAHALTLHAVVLIKQGTLFKTKSGKVSRSRTRSDFLGSSQTPLTIVLARTSPSTAPSAGEEGATPSAAAAPKPAPAPSAARGGGGGGGGMGPPGDAAAVRARPLPELVAEIKARIAFEANLGEEQIDVNKPLVTLGIGSMELVQIRGMLETLYGLDFEESVLATDQATVSKIAQAIKAGKIPDSMAKAAVIMPAPGEGDATEVGVTVQPKKPKRVGPPCCCIQ